MALSEINEGWSHWLEESLLIVISILIEGFQTKNDIFYKDYQLNVLTDLTIYVKMNLDTGVLLNKFRHHQVKCNSK